MTDAAKRTAAGWLLALALLLGVASLVLWTNEARDADTQRGADEIRFGYSDVEPDHTDAIVFGIGAGLSLICAVILFAGAGPPEKPDPSDDDPVPT